VAVWATGAGGWATAAGVLRARSLQNLRAPSMSLPYMNGLGILFSRVRYIWTARASTLSKSWLVGGGWMGGLLCTMTRVPGGSEEVFPMIRVDFGVDCGVDFEIFEMVCGGWCLRLLASVFLSRLITKSNSLGQLPVG
jgi:hypothetical protein